MTVWVDQLKRYPFATVAGARRVLFWCHLWSDDEDELHEFAAEIGCMRSWFQDHRIPHYDLSKSYREKAVAKGAIEMEFIDWLRQRRIKSTQ